MTSQKKNRANNHRNKRDKTASVRNNIRRDHFASGGSVSEWRGKHVIHKSPAEKRKTRNSERRAAIEDSEENG